MPDTRDLVLVLADQHRRRANAEHRAAELEVNIFKLRTENERLRELCIALECEVWEAKKR